MGISEESPIGKFLTTIKSKTPQELMLKGDVVAGAIKAM